MPILEVELIGEPDGERRAGLAQRLADRAGAVFDGRPRGTWVRLRVLDPADYAENGAAGEPGARPVFVRALFRERPTGERLADVVVRLANAVGEECGRPPQHVHVIVDESARGRIAFGGQVVD